MQINFFLKNHHMSGVGSLEDIIRPITAGLVEAGHDVQFEYVNLMPRPFVNILFEYFPDTRFLDDLRKAKLEMGDDLVLGLIGTEDLSDTISMGAKGDQKRLDNLKVAFGIFDFLWTIVPPDDYDHLLEGRMKAHFLEFGYCRSLQLQPAKDQTIDALLYGKLNGWRAPPVHRLIQAGANVQATFGDMPEFIRTNVLSRSKVVLDMRRGDVVRYMSPSRVCAALHSGSLVVSERFDESPLASLYRYVVAADYADLAETCLGLLADDEMRRAKAEDLRRLFAEETSMRANVEALIATIPV